MDTSPLASSKATPRPRTLYLHSPSSPFTVNVVKHFISLYSFDPIRNCKYVTTVLWRSCRSVFTPTCPLTDPFKCSSLMLCSCPPVPRPDNPLQHSLRSGSSSGAFAQFLFVWRCRLTSTFLWCPCRVRDSGLYCCSVSPFRHRPSPPSFPRWHPTVWPHTDPVRLLSPRDGDTTHGNCFKPLSLWLFVTQQKKSSTQTSVGFYAAINEEEKYFHRNESTL